jgi:hypothetical protein
MAVIGRRVDTIRKSDVAPIVFVRAGSKLVKWDKAHKADEHTSDGPVGSLELEPLLNFIRQGESLFASAPAEAARYEAERQAQKVVDDVVANGKGDTPQREQDADRAAGNLNADELVTQSVNVQMKFATAPEDQLTYGLIPNGAGADKVQASLSQTSNCDPARPTLHRTTTFTRSGSASSMCGHGCSTATWKNWVENCTTNMSA